MKQFYQVAAKFIRRDENGKDQKVTENYLLVAINFMEAEDRIHKELSVTVTGEFIVTKIAKSNLSEVIPSVGDRYYRGKIAFVILDENTGKSKRITQPVLVMADSVDQAEERIAKAYEDTTLGVDIIGVMESNIVEVFLEEKPAIDFKLNGDTIFSGSVTSGNTTANLSFLSGNVSI